LPAIYYYHRFQSQKKHAGAGELYRSKQIYLYRALRMISEGTEEEDFAGLAKKIETLTGNAGNKGNDDFTDIVIRLSALSSKHKTQLRQYVRQNKACLRELYHQVVKPLQIALIIYDPGNEKIRALRNTLERFCYYDVRETQPDTPGFAHRIIHSDFGLFTSTYPPRIHEDIRQLKSFDRAGIALACLGENDDREPQSIRHGAQLSKTGYPVLFKVFTPIRLFTSIDKEYMRFALR
jgi:hypothetical protein